MAYYCPLQIFSFISAFVKNYYCPRAYLERTIAVCGCNFWLLLLSLDIFTVGYYCPRTYLQRTITVLRHTYLQWPCTGTSSDYYRTVRGKCVVILKQLLFASLFFNNFLLVNLFSISFSDLESARNFAFFCAHYWPFWRKKLSVVSCVSVVRK